MADYTHTDLQLVGRHVPDPMVNAQGNPASPQELGHDVINPVTGTYEIGVIIEGAFVPLISEKASLIFDRITLAAQNQTQTDPNAPVETGPQSDQAAPEQTQTDQSQA